MRDDERRLLTAIGEEGKQREAHCRQQRNSCNSGDGASGETTLSVGGIAGHGCGLLRAYAEIQLSNQQRKQRNVHNRCRQRQQSADRRQDGYE